MVTRRKRFSSLGKLPGVASAQFAGQKLPLGSRAVIGSVAAQVLERALSDPGGVRLEIVICAGPAGRELSRDLAALGHRVRLFCDSPSSEGKFEGVEELDSSRFADLSCDLLVGRQLRVFDPRHDVRARATLLWLDDPTDVRGLTPALDRKLDGYLCSSAFDVEGVLARSPFVAPAKLVRLAAAEPAHSLVRACTAMLAAKRLDIVIFTGPALESWNPDTLRQNGMGGSETMAWELSRHLVELGHRVRVFAQSSGMEGLFDGVEWLDYTRFSDLTCDVLLSSRQPAAVDSVHSIQAKLRLLWVHDVHCGDKLTPARDSRTDAYLCLSAWHVACFRQHHPQVDPRKVLQVRNGIDLDGFPPGSSESREPLRAIYSSCPSRGLKIALDVWPEVRARVPGATLHVYYGFGNWERMAALNGDRAALDSIAQIKLRLANTEGVVYHGRVNPAQLAQHFRAASVWTYPDWFHETSCITAMQAQAAGLRIVTSALAALNETVGERGVLIPGDPRSDAYRTAFAEATVAALRSEPSREEREALQRYAARHFDLPRLAGEFVALFRALIQQKQTRPADRDPTR